MTTPKLCTLCYTHYLEKQCPHCASLGSITESNRSLRPSLPMAVLLGLGLTACPAKEDTGSTEDTSVAEPTSETSPEPADQPLYGVPEE